MFHVKYAGIVSLMFRCHLDVVVILVKQIIIKLICWAELHKRKVDGKLKGYEEDYSIMYRVKVHGSYFIVANEENWKF